MQRKSYIFSTRFITYIFLQHRKCNIFAQHHHFTPAVHPSVLHSRSEMVMLRKGEEWRCASHPYRFAHLYCASHQPLRWVIASFQWNGYASTLHLMHDARCTFGAKVQRCKGVLQKVWGAHISSQPLRSVRVKWCGEKWKSRRLPFPIKYLMANDGGEILHVHLCCQICFRTEKIIDRRSKTWNKVSNMHLLLYTYGVLQ